MRRLWQSEWPRLVLGQLGVRLCIVLAFARPLAAQTPAAPPPIQDNSFLIEEAYNQERGVVQHISNFGVGEGGWVYSFTQEWPAPSLRHQLSVTVPLQRLTGDVPARQGLGDIALNYRYQLTGDPDARLLVAPRASLLLPTGDSARELGAGGAGLQVNLPVTVVLSDRIVTHYNAGMTLVPRARNAVEARASTTGFNLGQSTIWTPSLTFHVLLEVAYFATELVEANDLTTREHSLLVSPGVRWSHNFANGLQIVPGIAVPLGVGPSAGDRGVFLYLSFEHAFRAQ